MSDSEDEDNYFAKKHLCLLLEQCEKLVKKACSSLNPTDPAVKEAIEAGTVAVNVLKRSVLRVDNFSDGFIKYESLDDSLQEFIYRIQIFLHEANQFKEERKNLMDMQLTMDALGVELKKSWNEDRERHETSMKEGQMSQTIFNKENEEPCIVEQQKSVTETALNPITEQKEAEKRSIEVKTPEGPRKKVKFARVSPKMDLITKFNCHLCSKSFSWLKSLRRHLKESHNGAEVPPNLKEIKDLVTCRICKKPQSRSLITRHLKEVHKVTKSGPGSVFRGFLTVDNLSWQPLWLEKWEEDPPADMMVRIEGNKINLYGVEFEVDGSSMDVEMQTQSKDSSIQNGVNDTNEEEKSSKDVCSQDSVETPTIEHSNTVNSSFDRKKNPVVRRLAMDDLQDEFHHEGGNAEEVLLAKQCEVEELDFTPAKNICEELQFSPGQDSSQPQGTVLSPGRDRRVEPEFSPGKDSSSEPEPSPVKQVAMETNEGGGEIPRKENLPLLKVEVFVVDVGDDEFWSADGDEWEVDSDFEDGDTKGFTESRLEMKKIRLHRRNAVRMETKLSDIEENAAVIKEFEEFLRNKSFETSTSDSNLSTIRKMTGHLFRYPDSLLQFNSERLNNYNLNCHLNPMASDFREVSDPTTVGEWLSSIAGASGKEAPGRRREQLKCHARFREFVAEKLMKVNFGFDAEGLYKRELLLKNLDQISSKIKSKKVFTKLAALEAQARARKQQARKIVYPNNNFKEQQVVPLWYKSKEAQQEEKACMKIYERAMSGSKVGPKDFNKFANWSRFNVAIIDKNRRSVYNFSNSEFSQRAPKWLPEKESDENLNEVDKFQLMPDSWNPDIPPEDGMKPSCWIVQVSGDSEGLKGGRAAQIILTPRSVEICLKYKEVKLVIVKDAIDDDCSFFVNHKGKTLAPLQRTPGSLLDKLGLAVGLNNPTINSFRRSAETKVQASTSMKASVEALQLHSQKVGLDHYDRSHDIKRANFISQLSSMETPEIVETSVPDHVKRKREKMEEEEREKVLNQAKETLKRDKTGKKEGLSKKCKVKPEDRLFLQKFFSDSKGLELMEKFPDDEAWRRKFYRAVDVVDDEEGDNLRKLEEEMFAEVVKFEVEDAYGSWKGSVEQNKCADRKISNHVKMSFRIYEKSRLPSQKVYFKF